MSGQVTEWLERLRAGDEGALDHLVPLLYDDLRSIARGWLRRERPDHTLGTTALVHESYLRLLGSGRIRADDRDQFFAVAANVMRRVLLDWARARKRQKRGGDARRVSLDDLDYELSDREASEVLAVDEALQRFAEVNPRGAKIVELRFFGGLTVDQIAELLELSERTVYREWVAARAWLRQEVAESAQLKRL
jgi:RNA polymerase sigma factor (TIGR02999 family)